jgi:hypothetical protein
MPKPPSREQLHYLKNLGYGLSPPRTSLEASVAIDAMIETGDQDKAEAAIRDERRAAGQSSPGCAGSCLSGFLKLAVIGGAIVVALIWWATRQSGKPAAIEPARPKPAVLPAPLKSIAPDPQQPAPVVHEKSVQLKVEEPERKFAPEKQASDANREHQAAALLKAGKALQADGKKSQAMRWFKRVADEYPGTEAAKEAGRLID